jgi:hypothetical protein
MNKVSLGAAADQTKSFMRRERGLVLPVAFATFGIALILIALVTPEAPAGQQVQPGLWSLAVIPLMFLAIIGQLSISYLVLRPGSSVRDALWAALGRLPAALGLILLVFAAFVAAGLLLILILGMLAVVFGATETGAAALGALAVAIVLLFMAARLLMAWPLLADRRSGPLATLKQAFALSKGRVWKFLALTLAFALVYVALTGAVQLGLGSLLLIFGKLLGAEAAATFLTVVAVALFGAGIQAVWAVLLANIYRQLTPPAEEAGRS